MASFRVADCPEACSLWVWGQIFLVAVISGCGETNRLPGITGVRDSAGVHIIENSTPVLSAEHRWSVGEHPTVVIGLGEADTMQVLHRVNGGMRLRDGRIVIVQAIPPMIRWYRADGTFLHGTGRDGGGPGEFPRNETSRNIRIWRWEGDSVAVFTHSLRRIQIFDPDGEYAREMRLAFRRALGEWRLVGGMGRGFVVSSRPRLLAGTPGDHQRDSVRFIRFDGDGTESGVIVSRPGFELVTVESSLSVGSLRSPVTIYDVSSPNFGKRPAAWAYRDYLYYGSTDRFEISVFDTAGALKMLVRRTDIAPRALTDELIEEYRRAGAVSDRLPIADNLPAFRDLRVDSEGALWVQEYEAPGATAVDWSVFAEDGRWLTSVRVPTSLAILDIGRDYLMALERSDLDVPFVSIYQLVRRRG